jgi:thiosulfate/3-mercaptopyruvate sulfurtransferase
MRWMTACLLAVILVFSCQGQSRRNPVFVSTAWLSEHQHDRGLIVLHVAFSRPEYRFAHIPEARFLWFDWLAVSTPDASTEMPSFVQADSVLEGLGITDSSTIILCSAGSNVSTTTRMFLALSYFGLGDRTSVLDGGLERWKSEKRTVSTETPDVQRTRLTLRVNPAVITDAAGVRAVLGDSSVAIVDARDKRFYDGSGGSISRTGHIRGARSIPFGSVMDSTNRLKSHAALQKILSESGIHPGMKIISYCHVGQQATVVYAAAKELGYDASVYDGSFQDWSLRGEDYPVDRPEPEKK